MYSLNFGSSFLIFLLTFFSSGDANFSFFSSQRSFFHLNFLPNADKSIRRILLFFITVFILFTPLLLLPLQSFVRARPIQYFDHRPRSPYFISPSDSPPKGETIDQAGVNKRIVYFCAFMAIVSVLYPINPRHLDADADRECVFTRVRVVGLFNHANRSLLREARILSETSFRVMFGEVFLCTDATTSASSLLPHSPHVPRYSWWRFCRRRLRFSTLSLSFSGERDPPSKTNGHGNRHNAFSLALPLCVNTLFCERKKHYLLLVMRFVLHAFVSLSLSLSLSRCVRACVRGLLRVNNTARAIAFQISKSNQTYKTLNLSKPKQNLSLKGPQMSLSPKTEETREGKREYVRESPRPPGFDSRGGATPRVRTTIILDFQKCVSGRRRLFLPAFKARNSSRLSSRMSQTGQNPLARGSILDGCARGERMRKASRFDRLGDAKCSRVGARARDRSRVRRRASMSKEMFPGAGPCRTYFQGAKKGGFCTRISLSSGGGFLSLARTNFVGAARRFTSRCVLHLCALFSFFSFLQQQHRTFLDFCKSTTR